MMMMMMIIIIIIIIHSRSPRILAEKTRKFHKQLAHLSLIQQILKLYVTIIL
jgi:hypothetical protein